MQPISSDAINGFRHRSKWLAYLLLKSVEALHKSGDVELASMLLDADRRWIERHHRGAVENVND